MKTLVCSGGSRNRSLWTGFWLATISTTGLAGVLLDTDLGTKVGVMTNQRWVAGYGNAGLLQIGGPTYNWAEPQFGYGDSGSNWSEGPAVFISNGTETFTHAWSAGDGVIQNTGVVKFLVGEPNQLLLTMDLRLSRGLQAPSSASGGWLTIQQDYYGPDLWSGPIDLEGGPFLMHDFLLNSPVCVITVYGDPATPYLGVYLQFDTASGSGPSVPEPTGVAGVAGIMLAGWGAWRRRARRGM